jgi:hypothetical protein
MSQFIFSNCVLFVSFENTIRGTVEVILIPCGPPSSSSPGTGEERDGGEQLPFSFSVGA